MRRTRTYIALMLMAIFCSYYAGASMFMHTHIVNGSSVIHSHLGGNSEHDHSDSQYTVIDILSNFQSEDAVIHYCTVSLLTPLSESFIPNEGPVCLTGMHTVCKHRGPPQC